MTRRIVCGIVVLLLMADCIVRAEEQPRTISTSGDSIIYAVPDEVIVTVGVNTANRELDRAKSINDDAAQRLVRAIKAIGVEDKYLGTDNVRVELRYEDSNRVISAYVVTRMYVVTLKDVKKLESLIDSALKNGANMLEGVEFRSTELRKHRDAARALAVKAAKEKAVALAKELDCAVGSPRTIGESGGWWYPQSNRYNVAQNAFQAAPSGGGDEMGETAPLGQIAIRATVSAVFDLIPGNK